MWPSKVEVVNVCLRQSRHKEGTLVSMHYTISVTCICMLFFAKQYEIRK